MLSGSGWRRRGEAVGEEDEEDEDDDEDEDCILLLQLRKL
jgi:hypothetical protein